jgi:hypothetical protein
MVSCYVEGSSVCISFVVAVGKVYKVQLVKFCSPGRWYMCTEMCQRNALKIYVQLTLCIWLAK